MMSNNYGVLISIHPEFVSEIAAGRKIYEIRKNRPDMQAPFKVYVYCTLTGQEVWLAGVTGKRESYKMNGKVCMEFTCDRIDEIASDHEGWYIRNSMNIGETRHFVIHPELKKETGLDEYTLWKYFGSRMGFAWRIKDLKVYEKPLMIEDFTYAACRERVKKPPQNYTFVDHPSIL